VGATFEEAGVALVILRGCDFFVFRPKVMLKTRSLGTKKPPFTFSNLITSSERSEGSQLSVSESRSGYGDFLFSDTDY
jgi:hypothetical protein